MATRQIRCFPSSARLRSPTSSANFVLGNHVHCGTGVVSSSRRLPGDERLLLVRVFRFQRVLFCAVIAAAIMSGMDLFASPGCAQFRRQVADQVAPL
jgi:hypothetical protein